MKIDLEKLSEAELIELNHRIVERLRFLNQQRAHSEMMEFSVGEKVAFKAEGRDLVTGVLVKYNRKTVTVITDAGERWNVAPSFLQKAEPRQESGSASGKVIPWKKQK